MYNDTANDSDDENDITMLMLCHEVLITFTESSIPGEASFAPAPISAIKVDTSSIPVALNRFSDI